MALILQEERETVAAGISSALGSGRKDLSGLGKCHLVPVAHLFPTISSVGPNEPPTPSATGSRPSLQQL